jgi:hypothetical protein
MNTLAAISSLLGLLVFALTIYVSVRLGVTHANRRPVQPQSPEQAEAGRRMAEEFKARNGQAWSIPDRPDVTHYDTHTEGSHPPVPPQQGHDDA